MVLLSAATYFAWLQYACSRLSLTGNPDTGAVGYAATRAATVASSRQAPLTAGGKIVPTTATVEAPIFCI